MKVLKNNLIVFFIIIIIIETITRKICFYSRLKLFLDFRSGRSYHKKIKNCQIKVNIIEDEEAIMIRFLNILNKEYWIKRRFLNILNKEN